MASLFKELTNYGRIVIGGFALVVSDVIETIGMSHNLVVAAILVIVLS